MIRCSDCKLELIPTLTSLTHTLVYKTSPAKYFIMPCPPKAPKNVVDKAEQVANQKAAKAVKVEAVSPIINYESK